MSWDVCLRKPDGTIAQVPEHTSHGGTHRAELVELPTGTRLHPATGNPVVLVAAEQTDAELNVTFNYAEVFRLVMARPFGDLDGMKASEAQGTLDSAVALVGDLWPWSLDYWAPTPGNAAVPLRLMADWGKLHPDATWEVH